MPFELEAASKDIMYLWNVTTFYQNQLKKAMDYINEMDQMYSQRDTLYHQERRRASDLEAENERLKRINDKDHIELENKNNDLKKAMERLSEWETYTNTTKRGKNGKVIDNKKPKPLKQAAGVLLTED